MFLQETEPSNRPTFPPLAPIFAEDCPIPPNGPNTPWLEASIPFRIGPFLPCGAQTRPSLRDQSFMSDTRTRPLESVSRWGDTQVAVLPLTAAQGVFVCPPW